MSSPESTAIADMARLLGYLREDPDNLRLRADIFDRALAAGLHDEARRQVDWVLRRTPFDFGWRHRMALLDMALGQLESAGLLLQSLIDEGQSDAVVAYNRAYVDFLQGRFQPAVYRLLKLRSEGTLPTQGLPLLLRSLHRLGELNAALELFQASIDVATSPDAFGVAALLAVDAGRLALAEDWAARALARHAVSQEALVAMGSVALARQDAVGALQFLDEAARRQPDDGRTWSAVGLAQLLRRDLNAAHEALTRAVKTMPDHIGTWHTLGWCDIFRHDLPGAKAAFEASVALDRNFGESHGGVAAVLALQGDHEGAQASLRRALRLNPISLSAQYAQSVLNGEAADFEKFRKTAQVAFEAHQGPGGKPLSSLVFGGNAASR